MQPKRSLVALVIFIGLIGYSVLLYGQANQKTPPSMTRLFGPGRDSYHIAGSDTAMTLDIWAVVTRVAFTQLARPDTIRVISSSTADSPRITIYGILNADSGLQKETFRISGTDSVFGPRANEGGAKRFKYFAYAVLDTEAAGTVSIIGKTSGLVTTIRPGFLSTEVVHHFIGRRGAVITGWGAEADTTAPVEVELRFYPDFADNNQTPETGKRVLDAQLLRTAAGDSRTYKNFPPVDARWEVHSAGYLAVFARGGGASKVHSAFLDVYEK